ncbi:MAG TPA: carbonic anhydrase [Thermoanaerobaculia bacterium]|nr:carbonic anhydrase [Thermoanaerobaculia bacterium]
MISAVEALARLREGNLMFAAGRQPSEDRVGPARRKELVAKQEPIAIILGCSDSRITPEFVFGQGVGDLFVIRVGGHAVLQAQVGSIEFAAALLRTPLVVVLGHSGCGVVEAALKNMLSPLKLPENLRAMVERVTRSIQEILTEPPEAVTEELIDRGVRANVRSCVEQLRHGSPELEEMIQNGRLRIVGAEYSLKTGLVDFLPD